MKSQSEVDFGGIILYIQLLEEKTIN